MPYKAILIALIIGATTGLSIPAPAFSAGIAQISVPTLRRPVSAGNIISSDDLTTLRVSARRAGAQFVRASKEIIGLAAQRRLAPGQPLRLGDFAPPATIKKGARITMVLSASGLRLTAIATAMEDGRVGDYMRVMNVTTKQVVSARVAAPNLVEVMPVGQLALR